MKTLVKICGVTNVADALAAAEAGADLIGLNFYENSPRHITLAEAVEILRAMPPFVQRVGVFVNPSEDLVMRAIAGSGLNLLQFHGDEPSDFCTQFGLMSLKAIRVRDEASLQALADFQTDAFLLDAHSPKRPRRHGRKIQLGVGGCGAKILQADFSRRRIDAGKCRRSHPKSPPVRRGCFQRRGIRAREKGRG